MLILLRYTEMLEKQQAQLVAALQEMYRRMTAAHIWPQASVVEYNDQPMTHDILAGLNLLDMEVDEVGATTSPKKDFKQPQPQRISEKDSRIDGPSSWRDELKYDESRLHHCDTARLPSLEVLPDTDVTCKDEKAPSSAIQGPDVGSFLNCHVAWSLYSHKVTDSGNYDNHDNHTWPANHTDFLTDDFVQSPSLPDTLVSRNGRSSFPDNTYGSAISLYPHVNDPSQQHDRLLYSTEGYNVTLEPSGRSSINEQSGLYCPQEMSFDGVRLMNEFGYF